jgi:plasmid maintenance system killer protein
VHLCTITLRVIASTKIWEGRIQVEWVDRKLGKAQGSDRAGQKLLGDDRWTALKRRVRTLEVANTLADVRGQAGNFHALSADRVGEWSASISPNWRLVFEPADDPLPTLADGGLDTTAVRRVRVLRVEDYHHGR